MSPFLYISLVTVLAGILSKTVLVVIVLGGLFGESVRLLVANVRFHPVVQFSVFRYRALFLISSIKKLCVA